MKRHTKLLHTTLNYYIKSEKEPPFVTLIFSTGIERKKKEKKKEKRKKKKKVLYKSKKKNHAKLISKILSTPVSVFRKCQFDFVKLDKHVFDIDSLNG